MSNGRGKTLRSVTVTLFAVLATLLASVGTATPANAAPNPPPWFTYSFYITSYQPSAAYYLGYSQGEHDRRDLPGEQGSLVILLFGQPSIVNNRYGAFMYDQGATFLNTTDIYGVATAFGDGYVAGLQGEGSRVTLALGVTNLGRRVNFNDHGYAWGGMVNTVQSYFQSAGYSGRISAEGSGDFELDWNDSGWTLPWIGAFGRGSSNQRLFIYTGDSAACPQFNTTATPGSCNNGWN